MSLYRRLVMLVVASVLGVALMPALAVAAPPDTDMWALGAVDMADLTPGKEPTYIISLQLKKKVELPVEVAVPLPKGVNVVWTGEVFFGDPSLDKPAEDAKIVKDGGTTYLVTTMSTSRALQIECSTAPDMFVSRGATADVNLYWIAPKIPGDVRLAVVVPKGYKAQTTPEDVEVKKATDGTAYLRTYDKTTDGQRLELALTMVAGEPTLTDSADADAKGDDGDEESTSATGSAAASSTASTATTPPAAAAQTPPPSAPATPWAFIIVMAIMVIALVVAVGALVMAIRGNKS